MNPKIMNADFEMGTLKVIEAYSVLAAIQLASRHPKATGPAMQIAISYAKELQEKLEKIIPDQGAIMQMGWDANFDIE